MRFFILNKGLCVYCLLYYNRFEKESTSCFQNVGKRLTKIKKYDIPEMKNFWHLWNISLLMNMVT